MCVSALETAADPDNIEFVCYRDIDDKTKYEFVGNYIEIIGKRVPGCDMLNDCQKIATGDIYMLMSDDFVFETKGWDKTVLDTFDKYPDKIVLVWLDDNCYRSRFAQSLFLHKNWVDTVGYFAAPYFATQYIDNWWNDIASIIGRKEFVRHFVVRHNWVADDETHAEYMERSKQSKSRAFYNSMEMQEKRKIDAGKLQRFIDKTNGTVELSIIIPARNEMFLARTIQDILEHSEANTEIIAVLDGAWASPGIPQHERVNVIYLSESIGQRSATNVGARLAQGKYILKCDAHCSFDKGFDRIMIEGFAEVGDNVVMVPIMRNLHAFDWVCTKCDWKKYQGPTPLKCEKCGNTEITRKVIWYGKPNPQSTSYCFDKEPHFQYFNEYRNRPEVKKMLKDTGFTETMSLQGSCFMTTKEKYFELELCGEDFGSWGNQGIEVACRAWLSGSRVLVNHKTWYAHMFRTQGGDFGFPYPQSGRGVAKTKKMVWEFFLNGKCEKQKYPVSWLIRRFWPVKGWTEADLQKLKILEKVK